LVDPKSLRGQCGNLIERNKAFISVRLLPRFASRNEKGN